MDNLDIGCNMLTQYPKHWVQISLIKLTLVWFTRFRKLFFKRYTGSVQMPNIHIPV